MGQITNPSAPGIQVRPVDRESGPGAGPGASGSRAIFLGLNAGINSAISDFIAIGNASGGSAAFPMTDANSAGSTVLGSGALQVNTDAAIGAANPGGPNTAIGFNAGNSLVHGGANVIVGSNALALTNGTAILPITQNVVIGTNAGQYTASNGLNALNTSVIIGANAVQGTAALEGTVSGCVIIGANVLKTALTPGGANRNMAASVIIGTNAFSTNAFISGNGNITSIGNGTDGPSNGNSVYVGSVINATGKAVVAVGDQIQNCGTSYNVVLGDHAKAQGSNAVLLGSMAGNFEASTDSKLIIEYGQFGITAANLRLVYGDFTSGALILGNSSVALANQDFRGTNTIKIINGTRGAGNPVGGGFFYVNAGALHWVGSAGTDTTVAVA